MLSVVQRKWSAVGGTGRRWLLAGLLCAAFGAFIVSAPSNQGVWTYGDVVLSVATALRGDAPMAELAQDIYGFRALGWGLNPYANLHTAMPLLGAEWADEVPTTHPPTAFLLVAPIAWLPLRLAFAAWAWLMLAAIIVALRAYEFSWPAAVALGLLALLWPPTITALGNLPGVWMVGLALAYQQRQRHPFLAGAWVAVASFTKLLPAGLLVLFVVQRKWSAVAGFGLTWAVALAGLLALAPEVLTQYLATYQSAAVGWIVWFGNASPLVFLYRNFGLGGLGVGLYGLLAIVALNWRSWLKPTGNITPEAWRLFSLLAVVLLPIAWAYSIAPLYPDLLRLAREWSPRRVLGWLALAGPVVALGLGWPSIGLVLLLLLPYGLSWFFVGPAAHGVGSTKTAMS